MKKKHFHIQILVYSIYVKNEDVTMWVHCNIQNREQENKDEAIGMTDVRG